MRTSIYSLVTNQDLDTAFAGTNFGELSKRDLIANTLLKLACGYRTGHTAAMVMQDLFLTTSKGKLTNKGKEYLWLAYWGGKSL